MGLIGIGQLNTPNITRSHRLSFILMLGVILTITMQPVRGEDSQGKKQAIDWTGGIGLSYPLVASLSGGMVVPLGNKKPNSQYGMPGIPAFRANADLGIGGGMVSTGVSFPVGSGYSRAAICLKIAALRTWLVDVGVKPDQQFYGGLLELTTPGHLNGKLGIGYFQNENLATSKDNNVVYLYFGVGI